MSTRNEKKNLDEVLERLFLLIESRKKADPSSSYTAKLFESGVSEISKKVGEEAVETIISAIKSPKNVAAESADLLFHLLVLWSATGVKPNDVFKELKKREGISGIMEKKLRK